MHGMLRKIVCSLFIFSWVVMVVSGEEVPLCGVTTNGTSVVEACCPCLHTVDTCSDACPDNYYRLTDNTAQFQCPSPSTTPTVTMTTTTATVSVTMETEDDTDTTASGTEMVSSTGGMNTTTVTTQSSTVSTKVMGSVIICLKNCPTGYYGNDSNHCIRCDQACQTCNGSTIEDCIECKLLHEGQCVSQCPENFETSKNSKNCTEIPADSDKKLNILIIAGAAGGGGAVLLIILIVVIVCCCCRRRGNRGTGEGRQRKAISILNENRLRDDDKDSDPGETVDVPRARNHRRPNYINTAPIDPELGTNIQQQGDVVLRYTKDPTVPDKPKLLADPVVSGLYENDATIKRALMERAQEEQNEIDRLPVAPTPPDKGPSGTKPKTKTKKGIKKQPAVIPVDEEPGDYIPMENQDGAFAPNDEPVSEEVYENTAFGVEDEELYENQRVAQSATGSAAMTPVSQSADDVGDNEEDYENTKQFKIENPYQNMPFGSQKHLNK